MEFTKRSNLGPLVAAVMVGLLSLCINQVFRVGPEDVDRFLDGLGRVRMEIEQRTRPMERTPLRLLDDLKRVERVLNNIFHQQVRGRSRDTDQVIRVVGNLTSTAYELENHEQATSQQVQQGRMLELSGLFLAAQLMPNEFSEQFLELGDRILNTDSSVSQNERVQLLTSFHEFHIGQNPDAVVLQMLDDYSQRQIFDSLAIRLYLLISQEVWIQGRIDLARDILLQGVKIYHDHPDKQKLANRLIDLKIGRSPPNLFE